MSSSHDLTGTIRGSVGTTEHLLELGSECLPKLGQAPLDVGTHAARGRAENAGDLDVAQVGDEMKGNRVSLSSGQVAEGVGQQDSELDPIIEAAAGTRTRELGADSLGRLLRRATSAHDVERQ